MAVEDARGRLKKAVGGLVLVTLASLASCASAEEFNQELKPKLLDRASFDLNCQETLHTKPLQTNDEGYIQSYGVAGCGKRATYVLAPTGVWIMNSGSDGKPSARRDE